MEGNTEFRPVVLLLLPTAGAGAAARLQGGDWAGAGQGQAGVCRGDAVVGGDVICNKSTRCILLINGLPSSLIVY